MYYLSLNLRLQLKEEERGWRRQKIKLSEILEKTLLKLSWGIQSSHLEICATINSVCSASSKKLFGLYVYVCRTYWVCVVCVHLLQSWRCLRHRGLQEWQSYTFLHVHQWRKRHANSSCFKSQYTSTLKSTLSVAATLHRMPMKE